MDRQQKKKKKLRERNKAKKKKTEPLIILWLDSQNLTRLNIKGNIFGFYVKSQKFSLHNYKPNN